MQIIVTIVLAALTAMYACLFLLYRFGWGRVPLRTAARPKGSPFISVIIPARDEAARLPLLLKALQQQDYPRKRFEVIVVDDFSGDDTAEVARSFAMVNCIRMSDLLPLGTTVAFKKAALTAGIAAAKGEYILTTDADCTAGPGWLSALAAAAEQDDPVLLAGPVVFTHNGSLLQAFQAVDFMMMQGITAASHALNAGGMSNGANLFFRKDAFEEVGGYEGADHIASGDDYLLLAKLTARYPRSACYLRSEEAIVSTAPQETWGGFLSQRIRWSSKTGRYKDGKLTAILLLVYVLNAGLLAYGIAAIWIPAYRLPLLMMFLAKLLPELALFIPVSRFFRQKGLIAPLILLQPLHMLYITVAGFFGMIGGYTWKGRRVR